MRASLESSGRPAFDRAAQSALEPTLWAIGLGFAVLASTQRWFSEPRFAFELGLLQGSIALGSLALAIAFRGRPPRPAIARAVLLGVCAAVAVNNGVILARIGDPQHSTNMLFTSIFVGFVFLERPWLLAALGLTLASWLPTALDQGLLSPGWSHWTKMLACSQVVGIVISMSRRRTIEAIEANRRLEAAMREPLAALGTMTAGIAHQLNNPLGAILASTELALACEEIDAPNQDGRRQIAEIHAHAHRAAQIARSVLRMARSETPERWRCDVASALDTARRVTDSFAAERDGRILLEIDPPVRKLRVVMNPIEFEEAIVNLIRNGIESRPSGACVRLDARRQGEEIVIVVEDDGPGIPKADEHRIFEPFFTTKARTGGSGLGLAMAARTIAGLGGTLSLVATPREPLPAAAAAAVDRRGGARFMIRLPVAPDEG